MERKRKCKAEWQPKPTCRRTGDDVPESSGEFRWAVLAVGGRRLQGITDCRWDCCFKEWEERERVCQQQIDTVMIFVWLTGAASPKKLDTCMAMVVGGIQSGEKTHVGMNPGICMFAATRHKMMTVMTFYCDACGVRKPNSSASPFRGSHRRVDSSVLLK